MSIVKDQRIHAMLGQLAQRYGSSNFLIIDHWEADLQAIGVTDLAKEYLIYVSTHGREEGRFYVSIERSLPDGGLPYTSLAEYEDIDMHILENLIQKYFRL